MYSSPQFAVSSLHVSVSEMPVVTSLVGLGQYTVLEGVCGYSTGRATGVTVPLIQ